MIASNIIGHFAILLELGWPKDQIIVVDNDLAKSANGIVKRNGFDVMFTDVASNKVGLILSIEVSRLKQFRFSCMVFRYVLYESLSYRIA